MPVYEDLDATRDCLGSLLAQRSKLQTQLIVVDDHSPNFELRAYLDYEAKKHGFLLIRNEENLGFAAAVNIALQHCRAGDVLLVNSDTLAAPRCVDRLAAAANLSDDIGTVTPLSNNGELTSFPNPNVANEIDFGVDVAEIDRIAEAVNGDAVVDIPSGIGFFLYIKRACLNAVGGLPEIYSRGYFEDVEFCLRASEKKFRNVCATGVFVAHAGSRSFGDQKRALVVRNMATLESRFPGFRLQCAAFMEADPLKPARAAIEARVALGRPVVLYVCAGDHCRFSARRRARLLLEMASPPLALYCTCSPAGDSVEFRGGDSSAPQSLTFSLIEPSALEGLLSYLNSLRALRVEVFDVASLPDALLAAIVALKARMEVICSDLQWFYKIMPPPNDACLTADEEGLCPGCAAMMSQPSEGSSAEPETSLRRIRMAFARADAFVATDHIGASLVRRLFGPRAAPFETEATNNLAVLRHYADPEGVLAVIAPSPSALVDRQIMRISRHCKEHKFDAKIVVFGRCVDEISLMAAEDIFIAGAVDPIEYGRLIEQYGVTMLLSPYRTGFFDYLEEVARLGNLPKAYFDWSFGLMKCAVGDLSLDPKICDQKAAARIANWMVAARRNTATT